MENILNILYASQTGTAEDLAYEINDLAKSKSIETNLHELDDISIVYRLKSPR